MLVKHKNLYIRIKKSYRVIIGLIVILIFIVIFATIYNFRAFRDKLIVNEQEQLLVIAETTAQRMEQFISDRLQDIKILTQSISQEYITFDDLNFESTISSISNYLIIQRDKVYKFEIYNEKGIKLYETKTFKTHYDESINISNIDIFNQPNIERVKLNQFNKLEIGIIYKISDGDNTKGYLRMIIMLDDMYNMYVKNIQIGSKGYVSVKDSNGILLMHPKKEDLGINVMVARKSEYPDYDWSELENLVEEQKLGEKGTGIYHSIWYHDEKRDRIKKFSAYAPSVIGKTFWIVTVSMDYDELTNVASQYLYSNILIAGLIPVILTILLLYFLNFKKNLRHLENEQKYVKKVKELNIELEKDIEERKILEKELLKSKSKFKQLFNSINDLTFALNFDAELIEFKIEEVNNVACEILKYKKEELIGTDYLKLDKSMSLNDMEKLIDSVKIDGICIFESALTTSDGLKIPVEISGKIFPLDNKSMMMLVARDISDKKVQEEQIEKNRALLIYKFRLIAMGEMIANITHQWRQPLGSLSLMITNLEDAFNHNDMCEEYFRNVIDRTLSLINDMSNIIDEFRYFFNPMNERIDFDPKEQIKTSLEMVKDRLLINEVNVELVNNSNKYIHGYSNQLSQVILNILNNSIDAMKNCENNNKKIIIITEDHQENSILIIIKNNGTKLGAGASDRFFDAYFTTKKDRDGTGIGLYMTKMIIENNFSGEIEMMNWDEGVQTIIRIPIRGGC